MAFKYVALFALVSSAAAVAIQSYHTGHAQLQDNSYHHGGNLHLSGNYHQDAHHEEHYAPAHYEFAYEVHDEHTGDIKSQKESRDGDKVQGYYTLVEPDGHRRIVHYTADKHSGFNAKVEREFLGHQHVQNHHQNQHHEAQIHKIIAQPIHKIAISQPAQYISSHSLHQGNSHLGLSHGQQYSSYHH